MCLNQHSASSLLEHGPARAQRFGLRDHFEPLSVQVAPLDDYASEAVGDLLIKVDVEGFEAAVLEGAPMLLEHAAAVVVECQQAADVFVGAPPPSRVDELLRERGLRFAGVLAALTDPSGAVVQFDGVWLR